MKTLVIAGLLVIGEVASAQLTVDHTLLDQVLRERVKEELVDYQALKTAPELLDRYLRNLQTVNPAHLASPEEQLAFWINVYNACVVKGVLEHYPIRSVKEVKGFFDGLRFRVANGDWTLNQLETKARALGDWRVHFALVCASSSCPPLRAEAYLPARLEAQLTEQTRQFLRDPARGLRVNEARRILWVSKIFKWYAKDFVRQGPLTSETLLLVLHRHLDPALMQQAQRQPLALNFLEYDWMLNDQPHTTSP